MSKVTRSKLKFLIYILLQETNKINPKFFQILNDFLESTLLQAGLSCHESDFLLVGELPNPLRTLPAASGCASVPDALTAVLAIEKAGMLPTPASKKYFIDSSAVYRDNRQEFYPA